MPLREKGINQKGRTGRKRIIGKKINPTQGDEKTCFCFQLKGMGRVKYKGDQ